MIKKIVSTKNQSGFFYHLPKYHRKILLGDFNAKLRRENVFKLTNEIESPHQDSNDNGVRIVTFATSQNLVSNSMTFPHQNIYQYTLTSLDGKTQNHSHHIWTYRRWH